MSRANPNVTLAAGLVLIVVTIGGYLYAAQHALDFAPILAITGPVIAALFLQNGMTRIERKTDQAVENTNGVLGGPLADLAAQVAAMRAQLAAPSVELGETPPSTPPSSTH